MRATFTKPLIDEKTIAAKAAIQANQIEPLNLVSQEGLAKLGLERDLLRLTDLDLCSPGMSNDDVRSPQQRAASTPVLVRGDASLRLVLLTGVLGVILHLTMGHLHPVLFPVLALSFLVLLPGCAKRAAEQYALHPIAWMVPVVFLLCTATGQVILYRVDGPLAEILNRWMYGSLWVSLALVASGIFLALMLSRYRTGLSLFLWAAIALICFAGGLVLRASPVPFIDVFVINSLATDAFLQGSNPYAMDYPDIYAGAYGYSPGFTYWPGYLLLATPFRLLGDIRLLGLACWIISIILIYRTARVSGWSIWDGTLISLIWASFPVSLFVLEQAWVDWALIAVAAGIGLAIRTKHLMTAAILAGLAAGTKQYGFLITIPTLMWIASVRGFRLSLAYFFVAGVVAALLVVPFAIWDFDAFYSNTIELLVTIPSRPDALSFPAWFHLLTGWWIPGWAMLAAYLLGLGYTAYRLLRVENIEPIHWGVALLALTSWIFLMGKQAFCNYYHMVAAFALLALALLPPQHFPRDRPKD